MSLSSRFCDLLPSSDTASPFTWTSPLSLHDALPISPENLTPALHPAGVRSCRRLSQGKTRNFLPRCKPGQVVIFLMFRTVVHQKFCRTKGVRNHHCCCKRTAARCQFGYDDRSEEHTSELQSRGHLVCRLLLEKKKQRRDS